MKNYHIIRYFIKKIPRQYLIACYIIGGLTAGLGAYTVYISRAYTYLSDEPTTCINCHVMIPYYHSWNHSSHTRWTICNDCHVPQDNVIEKYAFKAMDGLYHSAVFTFNKEPQVIRPREASSTVIMNNCIRCHTQLNTEFVKTGMISYKEVKEGRGKACWDCHANVPHTKISNLASTPDAIAPLPAATKDMLKRYLPRNDRQPTSNVSVRLKEMMKNNN